MILPGQYVSQSWRKVDSCPNMLLDGHNSLTRQQFLLAAVRRDQLLRRYTDDLIKEEMKTGFNPDLGPNKI